MSALLDGRVIIVTGAARGIGQAYAKGLADAGATVVAADILDCGETVGLLGGRGTGLPLDVTDMASCTAMADATLKAYGRIDGIINNAAMFGPSAHTEGGAHAGVRRDRRGRLAAHDEHQRHRHLARLQGGGAGHAPQGYGKIVNISSNTIQLGNPNLLHYVVSKGAVATMTRCLARNSGPPASASTRWCRASSRARRARTSCARTTPRASPTPCAICSLGREQYADDLVGTAVSVLGAVGLRFRVR